MSRKRVYKCEAPAITRNLLCGKAKASASCLEGGILGGRCPNLAISTAPGPKISPREKRETPKQPTENLPSTQPHGLNIKKVLDVINAIQFVPSRKEKGYEAQLYQAFRAKELDVKYQGEGRGARFDLVFGNGIAVELKVVRNRSIFDPLFGQIDRYQKQFGKVIIVLIDKFENPSIMNEEKERLKRISPANIEVIVK
jgi:hypothetical protein